MQRKNENIAFKTITSERIKKELLDKNHLISQGVDFNTESGGTYGSKVSEGGEINNINEDEIQYLTNKYKLESEFRWNVLRKFDDLSKTTKYSSSFIKFLRKLNKSEDKNELLAFLYILHNLILISKKHDKQIYSKIVIDYKPLLRNAFINFKGKHSYSQTKNMLHSLDLSNQEWCELHWKRIKNAIAAGIAIQEIEKVYDNITYLRNSNCKSLPRYRKYLGKKDEHVEIKKE